MSTATAARRGWREKIDKGFYRAHRTACPSSRDERPGRRRGCPIQFRVPAATPGTSRTVTFEGTMTDARAHRTRILAAGRPAPEPESPETLHEHATAWFALR